MTVSSTVLLKGMRGGEQRDRYQLREVVENGESQGNN